MRFLKKILLWFVIVIATIIALLYLFKVDYLLKAVRTIYLNGHTTAFLKDYTEFDNRTVPKSHTPQPWATAKDYNGVKPTDELQKHTKQVSLQVLAV